MADYDFDLFVIGAGSGGVRAARLAAMSGAKVAVAEEYRVGGTCVIRGCVPKKFMVYASEVTSQLKTAKGYGWTIEGAKFDWKGFLHDKDVEIARLSGIYVTNLQKAGAHLLHGRAQILDAHTVEVLPKEGSKDAGTYTAKKILVATGGRPVKPDFPGAEFGITSDEAFHLPKLPKSILVVGGGYIAVEFAGIFNGLGVETTLLYRGANILRGFDDDVRSHLAEELEKRGVKVVLGCSHTSIEKQADGTLLSTLTSDLTFETEAVMFATGREPYVQGLGLEKAGVKLNDSGAIAVDAHSKTSAASIWAVGDVTDRINLTPVAIREGAAFAQTEFYDNPTTFDHDLVASAVFSQPPVGSVGMTEAEARHAFGTVDVYRSVFRPMKITFYGGQERCLMKLVVKADDQKVIGVHVVGPDSPEIIQMAAIAVKMGVTKQQWDSTCAVHPTLAEELVTMREKYVPVEVGGVG
ncbi:glutathione-disulfide reductase [Caulobacter sp. 602-1]|uniref:glutathione-disulfide reductase n=1 Tax=Caulobacter sp. 602-1 TaxID=2492472 RepID=UPI000F63FCAA|nr:glutathione-disulfide reductase [Caulobacter sp. 602-1]RRN62804.1 glutathione-disulfide reductase [Caulobacter sp. 602-1]